MAASDKIEKAKNCFKGISESGKNNYQKFTYFETKDIFPVVRRVCQDYKLKTKFTWDYTSQVMYLKVTDQEDNSFEEYSLPLAIPNEPKAGNYMQSIGSIQTYAMRYLYIQCFEITVPDEIDNKPAKKNNKTKPDKKTITNVKAKPAPTEKPTEQEIKKALDHVYDIIVTRGDSEFTVEKATFQLRRVYKDNPRLIQACIDSLNITRGGQS